jgi:hypothetical protein
MNTFITAEMIKNAATGLLHVFEMFKIAMAKEIGAGMALSRIVKVRKIGDGLMIPSVSRVSYGNSDLSNLFGSQQTFEQTAHGAEHTFSQTLQIEETHSQHAEHPVPHKRQAPRQPLQKYAAMLIF